MGTALRWVAGLAVSVGSLLGMAPPASSDPPSSFNLRNVGGYNYVSSVKSRQGGTCWAHAAMAAMESNLMLTRAWADAGETGEPNLAEYHLDWWNGFNTHNNDDADPPTGDGLTVHLGGDYLIAAAYLARGEGAVRDLDGQSYSTPPTRSDSSYHRYYARDIEWYTVGSGLANIEAVKTAVMTHGAVAACIRSDNSFISDYYIHYQPPANALEPNQAVAIVGWDDAKATQAPQPGAWLCKNSLGSGWGLAGYFWVSYYDKHCGRHPELGAVSFQGVEPFAYDHVYSHDYHGYRDTFTGCAAVFNAFTVGGGVTGAELLNAISFYTAEDNVAYTLKVYDQFQGGVLLAELAAKSGAIARKGFHTVDLDDPVVLNADDRFYVYLQLSAGGYAYDRTGEVSVLLGGAYIATVASTAHAGESYYDDGSVWRDLYDHDFGDPTWNHTAGFCLKVLTVDRPYLTMAFPSGLPQCLAPSTPTNIAVQITDGSQHLVPGSGAFVHRIDGQTFQSYPLTPLGGDLYQATLPAANCGAIPEFYFVAQGDGGAIVNDPDDAPTIVYGATVGIPTVFLADNFETDQGWTAVNLGATGGYWQRGVPVNDPNWAYDPIADSDGSGRCYLTQNALGNTDVDNGAVRLISPMIDMSAVSVTISYDYYLYLGSTIGGVDRLLVEINSNNGEGAWTEIARHDTDGGLYWRHHQIAATELTAAGVSMTSTMRLRFTVNDADLQSIVEAGLDAFAVGGLACSSTADGDMNGDGRTDGGDIQMFVDALLDDPNPYELAHGDFFPDGTLDAADVPGMVAALLAA